ncbi:Sip5p PWA37_004118 [Arxiozyma heterogenica]|uniref:Sip5p n=1 Tax=Arxiozyma heterogenica TaxID=278026 RepID=UPI002EFE30AB
MGNTPTKLYPEGPTYNDTEFVNDADTLNHKNYKNRSKNVSLANTLLNPNSNSMVGENYTNNTRQKQYSIFNKIDRDKDRKKYVKDREKLKEIHARGLVVKYDECCDGGFLAPFGCYNFDKLDYNIDIVRSLIIERKLAPFYTPLQDFDETWSREEIIKIVDGLPLHATFEENLEEFEDVPIGDLKKPNFDYLVDRSLSKREQRRQHAMIFKARLYRKRLIWQETANESFLEDKVDAKKNKIKNRYLPSDDLKYSLYKNGMECPICFLHIPGPLNYSKCCQQPICTECFVQIKRSEPHFPHEEVDPTKPITDDNSKDPNLLISEPSNCPYCATPNFSITYTPPTNRRTGIGGIPPSDYCEVAQNEIQKQEISGQEKENKETLGSPTSISASASPLSSSSSSSSGNKHKDIIISNIITSDDIRPDWEAKLKKERSRLAKRAANATAIHVSNQLVDPEYSLRQNSNTSSPAKYSVRGTNSKTKRKQLSLEELEEQMIKQAIQLSLEDQEKSKKK